MYEKRHNCEGMVLADYEYFYNFLIGTNWRYFDLHVIVKGM